MPYGSATCLTVSEWGTTIAAGKARHQLLDVKGLFCGCCLLVVLYCAKVDRKRLMTKQFVRWLRQAGLNGLTAALLEAAGPLTYLGAQLTYIVEPLIGTRDGQFSELARTLEDPDEVLRLIEALRSEEGDP